MMMKKILEPIKGFHQAGKWGTVMMKTMMRIYIEYNVDVMFVRLFVTRNDHSEKISLSVYLSVTKNEHFLERFVRHQKPSLPRTASR